MMPQPEKDVLISRLHSLLQRTALTAGADFSGIGVIVTDSAFELPTFPLRPKLSFDANAEVSSLLASVSIRGGPQHDGFHVLSSRLKVVQLSQYFSPPIVKTLCIDRFLPFGGRYLAALFGSTIEDVLATGISTPALGTITFIKGTETSRELRS